jgi:hypothetical protein
MRTQFTSVASLELKEAIDFYESAENGLGASFLTEVEETTGRIAANPMAWTQMSPRTHRCRTHRFPYGLFYQIRKDEILILSVMDLRRDPRLWEQWL